MSGDDILNRLLYALTALALAGVVVLDGNLAANLSRAIGDEPLSLNPWEAGLGAILFAVAVGIALYPEWKR
jgi:hypothetical protein